MARSFYNNLSSNTSRFYPLGRSEISMRDEMINTLQGSFPEISKKQAGVLRVMRRDSNGDKIPCACAGNAFGEGDRHCPFCIGEGFYWDEQFVEFYMWEPGYDTSLALRQEEGLEPGNMRVPLRIFYLEYDEILTADDRVISLTLDASGTIIDPPQRNAIWRIGTFTDYRLDTGRLEFWKIVGWNDTRLPLRVE